MLNVQIPGNANLVHLLDDGYAYEEHRALPTPTLGNPFPEIIGMLNVIVRAGQMEGKPKYQQELLLLQSILDCVVDSGGDILWINEWYPEELIRADHIPVIYAQFDDWGRHNYPTVDSYVAELNEVDICGTKYYCEP
ncbi:hypothetical protein ICN48_06640 [Polynucleobacter sp. JS-Safj-400b-B2]|uniref:hypothetical protein n=1 Tax=Polynucleobacter sp. JS-Safj-400b-B2 TaxID=2576921 RepID=UPI001C0BF70C|nr:hypothetical protein [Polynucleobacter sp. JS-Safj-400b-B2]MBU3625910.1 hypothetical protein [Polynucleobacter sp. JS-Safj-400b-B2]